MKLKACVLISASGERYDDGFSVTFAAPISTDIKIGGSAELHYPAKGFPVKMKIERAWVDGGHVEIALSGPKKSGNYFDTHTVKLPGVKREFAVVSLEYNDLRPLSEKINRGRAMVGAARVKARG